MASYLGVPEEQVAPTEFFDVETDPCPTCLKMNLVYNNFHLSGAATQYICHGFALPVDKDRHIVAFEIIKDNVQVLHHIIVFESSTPFAVNDGDYPDCASMPNASPVWAWAPGTQRYELPPEAGVKVGPTGGKYFIFQTHYNNPAGITTFYDSSGIKIWLSDTLRPNDAGFMLIGPAIGRINLPPHFSSWHIVGGCAAKSTNTISALPSKKLTIVGEMHHMHGRGKQAWTDFVRAGTVVRRWQTPVYDYNAQKFVPTTWDIAPGDIIKVNCIYDTTKETANVKGCEATSCEMCLYAIMYYPLTTIGGCNDVSLEIPGSNCSFPC